jgi:hypothetical protein
VREGPADGGIPSGPESGDGQILVYPGGMGSGKAVRYEIRFEWLGMTIGLSPRHDATRQLSNFYVKIPGEPCLLHGAKELRQRLTLFLSEFDIVITDEWFRRLDVCLDLAGWNFVEKFAPACEGKQYFGSARSTAPYREGMLTTGFSVKTGAVDLVIYNKLFEACFKKPEYYLAAMIQNRWGGCLPEAATRIEYQFKREFLTGMGLNSVDKCLENLGGIVSLITRFGDHPFFVLTDCVPDREGRHQDRAGVLPDWMSAIERMRQLAGQPVAPLKRLERGMMLATRAVKNAIGYVVTAGAQLGMLIETRDDLVTVFGELIERNQISNDEIKLKWEDKARRAGTFETVSKFPFGSHLAV